MAHFRLHKALGPIKSACVQADVNIAEAVRGRTPLHEALARAAAVGACLPTDEAQLDIQAALLRAGASARSRDRTGHTPLAYAIDGHNAAALAALLAHETCPGRVELSRELRRSVGGPFEGERREGAGALARVLRARGMLQIVRRVSCSYESRLVARLSGMLGGARAIRGRHTAIVCSALAAG